MIGTKNVVITSIAVPQIILNCNIEETSSDRFIFSWLFSLSKKYNDCAESNPIVIKSAMKLLATSINSILPNSEGSKTLVYIGNKSNIRPLENIPPRP